MIRWQRYGGYEVSSAADKRFSPLYARLEDGRTIEQHYQCDVKGYNPGGTNWREYKGKPPLNPSVNLWLEFLSLYQRWARMNPDLIEELRWLAFDYNEILSDRFANTPVNQARALAHILNFGVE